MEHFSDRAASVRQLGRRKLARGAFFGALGLAVVGCERGALSSLLVTPTPRSPAAPSLVIATVPARTPMPIAGAAPRRAVPTLAAAPPTPASTTATVVPVVAHSTPTVVVPTRVSTAAAAPPAPAVVGGPGPLDSRAVVNVAARVRPAVVQISAQQVSTGQYLQPVPQEAGIGSGFLIDKSGVIITNNHVVEGARRLKVTLPDGRDFDGRLIGRDARTDLAIVKIDGQDLPSVALGDSDKLEIGEFVVAIGNALGLEGGPTVTTGVVGALGRYIETPEGALLFDLIQTDAAINPGNSGGPLLNLRGEVVGINTAIARAPGAGIGFAIAVNQARPIIGELVQRGRVVRPWLGVSPVTLTRALAAQQGFAVTDGIVVARVDRGSPAQRAGLRPLDVIVEMDDEKVRDVVGLLRVLNRKQVGDKLSLRIVRENARLTATLTLDEMPSRS